MARLHAGRACVIIDPMNRRTSSSTGTSLLFLLALLGAAAGGVASAAPKKQPYSPLTVVISEVAWAGTQADSNDEWIELYNPNPVAIDLTNWHLVSDDSSPNIAFSSCASTTIPAGGFYLLERTNDDTVKNIPADCIYTGALSNTGEILTLYDPDNSVIDTANADGGSWPAGLSSPPTSMERVSLLPDGAGVWQNNNGMVTNGLDQNDNPILGTPKQPNSVGLGWATYTPTATNTYTPSPLSHIVISEFRSRGLNGGDDEFIELYNPTSTPVSITGWSVLTSANCGSATSLLFTISSGVVLQPGQHFLATSGSGSSVSGADLTFAPAIADQGGIALVDTSLEIIDQVGMCATTLYREGTFLPPLSGLVDQSYERLPGSGVACTDSNDNSADFQLIAPASPQNLSSPLAYCSGVITATPTFTSTPTNTSTTSTATTTPTATSTATATATSTFTPVNPPAPPAHIVISEFRSRGPNGAGDEFVELYNPTGAAVSIAGWVVKRSSGCGSTINTLVTIDSSVTLQPGQHYLLVSNSGASVSGADKTFAPGIVNTGGVALFTSTGLLVDQVGMCEDTEFVEAPALAALVSDTNQSYERNPGGATACHDTDHNAADFRLISPSNPQNSASPIVTCIGAVTPTVTPTPSRTTTRTQTRTRTSTPLPTAYPGAVILNEVLPRPVSDWNSDGEVNSRDEYIEIINMGATAINIKNWKLDDGEGGSPPYTITQDIVLQPYEIARFFALDTGIALSDAGDTARLIKPDGRTADIWSYPVVTAADRTWCRLPDGDGVWGFVCRPTPGRPNALPGSTPDERPPQVDSFCPLPDTAPQAFRIAECESSGGGVWRKAADREFWLAERWKWDVYVK